MAAMVVSLLSGDCDCMPPELFASEITGAFSEGPGGGRVA